MRQASGQGRNNSMARRGGRSTQGVRPLAFTIHDHYRRSFDIELRVRGIIPRGTSRRTGMVTDNGRPAIFSKTWARGPAYLLSMPLSVARNTKCNQVLHCIAAKLAPREVSNDVLVDSLRYRTLGTANHLVPTPALGPKCILSNPI